jgi:hypothetical protein
MVVTRRPQCRTCFPSPHAAVNSTVTACRHGWGQRSAHPHLASPLPPPPPPPPSLQHAHTATPPTRAPRGAMLSLGPKPNFSAPSSPELGSTTSMYPFWPLPGAFGPAGGIQVTPAAAARPRVISKGPRAAKRPRHESDVDGSAWLPSGDGSALPGPSPEDTFAQAIVARLSSDRALIEAALASGKVMGAIDIRVAVQPRLLAHGTLLPHQMVRGRRDRWDGRLAWCAEEGGGGGVLVATVALPGRRAAAAGRGRCGDRRWRRLSGTRGGRAGG